MFRFLADPPPCVSPDFVVTWPVVSLAAVAGATFVGFIWALMRD